MEPLPSQLLPSFNNVTLSGVAGGIVGQDNMSEDLVPKKDEPPLFTSLANKFLHYNEIFRSNAGSPLQEKGESETEVQRSGSEKQEIQPIPIIPDPAAPHCF